MAGKSAKQSKKQGGQELRKINKIQGDQIIRKIKVNTGWAEHKVIGTNDYLL